MIEFTDSLYGRIQFPDWVVPFLRVPELIRLRGVRLSNVDSLQFKDFGSITRWEHSIAVAHLAMRCGKMRGLSELDLVHLTLAALFHDVATPPFAHTMEAVLQNFDHEVEAQRLLQATLSPDSTVGVPVYVSQLPQFRAVCGRVSKQFGLKIDPDEVARLITGNGEHGFLISGTLDLDNADNVTRASMSLGVDIDRRVPIALADWLATRASIPLNLSETKEEAVQKWLQYRTLMYRSFFESTDDELGRQAFLQRICRLGLRHGLNRHQLIWNTDDGLLTLLENVPERGGYETGLKELVQRYRLLEPVTKLAVIPIESQETLRSLRPPAAVQWIEAALSDVGFESLLFLSIRRYEEPGTRETLFPAPLGRLFLFKMGGAPHLTSLPKSIGTIRPGRSLSPAELRRTISTRVELKLKAWVQEKPWLGSSNARRQNVVSNLNAVGDWGFRLSRNETLHPYPSTFVHAIPACLIKALNLQGETILDTFGGTGQTAVEAIKAGGSGISADSNAIACMIAGVKLTYLSSRQRKLLRAIEVCDILTCPPDRVPSFENIEKWHHERTIEDLCRIKTFIHSHQEPAIVQFLTVCFSAILTSTTARRGKQHGWFADNTPLGKEMTAPPYADAVGLFLDKIRRNIGTLESFYGVFERSGIDPEAELGRAKIVRANAASSTPANYGVEVSSISGIVTSPPYLCMSDYSLGQRLSYYWLTPTQLNVDYSVEIGTRRSRTKPEQALNRYMEDFRSFAKLSSQLIRRGGFVAMVLGEPVARAFQGCEVLKSVDGIFREHGFSTVWKTFRKIHWHRNHGFECLRQERISVAVKD